MTQLATDLAAIAKDPLMGPSIVANGITRYMPLRWLAQPTSDGEGNLILVNERSLVVPSSVVTAMALAQASSITVGGVAYKVRDIRAFENDTLKELVLAPA